MATETKYTPGPWHVDRMKNTDGKLIYVVSQFGDIARVCGVGRPDDETMPNAHVLAAAPELLEALKELRKAFAEEYDDGRHDLLGSKVNAAIAKAEGRS